MLHRLGPPCDFWDCFQSERFCPNACRSSARGCLLSFCSPPRTSIHITRQPPRGVLSFWGGPVSVARCHSIQFAICDDFGRSLHLFTSEPRRRLPSRGACRLPNLLP